MKNKTQSNQSRYHQQLRKRRLQGAQLFKRGKSQSEVAVALSVSRQTASRWYHAWAKGGKKALQGAGRSGRKPKCNAQILQKIDKTLRDGPEQHGFSTNLWTLPRIATVIQRIYGIKYHPGHVWKLLRALGWSLQRPARKATQRDEEAIRKWKRYTWPAIKKKPAA